MTSSTTDPQTQAAPATSIPTGLGLNDLSKEEFELLIKNGGTITIGELNSRLKVFKVDASSLKALGITVRHNRGAVHMAAAGFRALCDKLLEHVNTLKER